MHRMYSGMGRNEMIERLSDQLMLKASLKDADSCFMITSFLFMGLGLAQCAKEAVLLAADAADAGSLLGMTQLGVYLLNLIFVESYFCFFLIAFLGISLGIGYYFQIIFGSTITEFVTNEMTQEHFLKIKQIESIFISTFSLVQILTHYQPFAGANSPFNEENIVNIMKAMITATNFNTLPNCFIRFAFKKNFSVGVEILSSKHADVRLTYGKYDDAEKNIMYYWDTDENGWNSSYPNNGTQFFFNQVLLAQIIDLAIDSDTAQWTELLDTTVTNGTKSMVSIIKRVFNNETNEVTWHVIISIPLANIQDLLVNITTKEHSRIAIQSYSSNLISLTGEDTPIDRYEGKVVKKNISQIRDPIWICGSEGIRRSGIKEVLFTNCNIDQNEHKMIIFTSQFDSSLESTYSIVCMYSLNEFEMDFSSNAFAIYAGVSLAFVVGFVIFYGIDYIFKSYRLSVHIKKLDKVKTISSYRHLIKPPMHTALSDLDQIFNTYCDVPIIANEIPKIIKDLTKQVPTPYSDIPGTTDMIKSRKIRRKFAQRFGKEKRIIPILDFCESESSFTKHYIEFDQINALRYKFCEYDNDNVLQKILSYFEKFNTKCQFFNFNDLKPILISLINQIEASNHWLLLDSLVLFDLIFDNHLDSIITIIDLWICIPLASLLFHVSQSRSSLIRTPVYQIFYLCNLERIFKITNELISQLSGLLSLQNDISKFSHCLLSIVQCSSPDVIYSTITRMSVFIVRSFEPIKTSDFISPEIGRLLYSAMMTSFIFGPKQLEDIAMDILDNGELDTEYMSEFLCCNDYEIFYPIVRIIERLTSKCFITHLFHEKKYL